MRCRLGSLRRFLAQTGVYGLQLYFPTRSLVFKVEDLNDEETGRRLHFKDAYRRSSGVKPVAFISGNYVFEIARMKVRIGQHVRIELINHIWICISR